MKEPSSYLNSGTRLNTAELLAEMGVDETAFLDAVRQAAAERFDGKNLALLTVDRDMELGARIH